MASWKKLLAAMVADPDPRSYTYEDAAKVLNRLDFTLSNPKNAGSHRLWRRVVEDGTSKRSVYIGLVEKGTGTLRPEYIKTMVRILQENGFLPKNP